MLILLRLVTGASHLVSTGAVLKLIIIFIKIQNTDIVDIVLKKQKTMIQVHRKYNINPLD